MSTKRRVGEVFLLEILPLDAVQRISMVCSKSARLATGNLCQKAQVAKNKGIPRGPDFEQALLTVGCFFQEQLTQESMEGVEAGEGETS